MKPRKTEEKFDEERTPGEPQERFSYNPSPLHPTRVVKFVVTAYVKKERAHGKERITGERTHIRTWEENFEHTRGRITRRKPENENE